MRCGRPRRRRGAGSELLQHQPSFLSRGKHVAHRRGSFRGRGISDSQRRKKKWIVLTCPTVSSDGASTANQTPNINLVIPGNVGGSTVEGNSAACVAVEDEGIPDESTILRIRGSVNLPKNVLTTSGNDYFAIGFGVMESSAAELGAFPNPATPVGGSWDGWMFYRTQQVGAVDTVGTIIDVKSMRKVQSGYSFFAAVGRFSSWTAGNLPAGSDNQVQLNMRMLVLLP